MKEHVCKGFKFAGVAAAIKKKDEKDLGIIFSEKEADTAGVFTRNRVKAACVTLNQHRIAKGKCQAIIANSGNANCCAGEQEVLDAQTMASLAADELGINHKKVLVASTGVIGAPMPMKKIKSAVPGLISSLSDMGFSDFAEAIMTTDTVPKIISAKGAADEKPYTMTGIAKGSGMIRPDMATMLCFVCTDVKASQDILKRTLAYAADNSFNKITVDGDTSTNDMVIIMANGMSDAEIKTEGHIASFQNTLLSVLDTLAQMIVQDGEGATKTVEIIVKGAASDKDARMVADTVANSNLVKTAFFGEDANWGRIIAAAGRAGVPIIPGKIDIYFDNVIMVKNGAGCGSAAEAEATDVLKKSEFSVTLDLHMGEKETSVFTCDFSVDYVKINADYRS